MIVYNDDEDAKFDWDQERGVFNAEGREDDLEETPTPDRFWIDAVAGLPVVRDRLYDDQVVAKFITLKAADMYKRKREMGMGHGPAMFQIEQR